MKHVNIYTDGACSYNPGPGAYAAILIYKNQRKEIVEAFPETTNNRMELLAVIASLEQLKEKCHVDLYSDSKYVVDSVNKGWLTNWEIKQFKKKQNEEIPNADLWKRLSQLLTRQDVTFHWIKGHNDHEENERCDTLARQAIKEYINNQKKV